MNSCVTVTNVQSLTPWSVTYFLDSPLILWLKQIGADNARLTANFHELIIPDARVTSSKLLSIINSTKQQLIINNL